MQLLLSALLMATGALAAGIGLAIAGGAIQSAHRTHDKTLAVSMATVEGWQSWFLGGFSSLTIGLAWLYAMAAWLTWTMIGLCLIGVGVHALGR